MWFAISPTSRDACYYEGGLAVEELAILLSGIDLSPPLTDLVGAQVSDARPESTGDLVDPQPCVAFEIGARREVHGNVSDAESALAEEADELAAQLPVCACSPGWRVIGIGVKDSPRQASVRTCQHNPVEVRVGPDRPAAWSQYPRRLIHHGDWIVKALENVVGQHPVDAAILKREPLVQVRNLGSDTWPRRLYPGNGLGSDIEPNEVQRFISLR